MKGGYPDHGSGRYTMELGYEGWMTFNKSQRIHYNFMESISQIITQLFVAGLYWPRATAIIGGIYVLGRFLFLIGYKMNPRMRVIGLPFVILTQLLMPIYTIVSLIYFAKNGVSVASFKAGADAAPVASTAAM